MRACPASPRNRADSGAAAGQPRNLRAQRPITARMTKLLSLPDPSDDVYAALWLGALLIASGAATEPLPHHLEAMWGPRTAYETSAIATDLPSLGLGDSARAPCGQPVGDRRPRKPPTRTETHRGDRKSTRLTSSHEWISRMRSSP